MVSVVRSPVAHRLEAPGLHRVGVVALSTDMTLEWDAARILPHDRMVLHVSRVAFENPTTPENLARMGPRLAEAAALIVPGITLSAVLYGCTAASVTLGDAAVEASIGEALPSVPVVTPPDAAVAAFAALSVRRVALVTPYLVETTRPMVRYFSGRGLEIVSAECMGISDDRDIARVDVESIVDIALAANRPDAEGIFLSCTALRAMDAIPTIEARLGKPVISSNQASLWRLLQLSALGPSRLACGRLFEGLAEDATA